MTMGAPSERMASHTQSRGLDTRMGRDGRRLGPRTLDYKLGKSA